MHMPSIGVESENTMGLIGLIKEGLPIRTFYNLKEKLGISEKALMDAMSISKRTLTRRKQDARLSATESEKIVRFGKLFDKAAEVFGNNEGLASRWFKTPARGLGGKTPIKMADTEIGAQEVHALLVRIEHGVFPG